MGRSYLLLSAPRWAAHVARRESGRGRRFAPEIRGQISGVGRRLRNEGGSWGGIGGALGLPAETGRRLCGGGTPGVARVAVLSRTVTLGRLAVVAAREGAAVRLTSSELTLFIEGCALVGKKALSPPATIRNELAAADRV